MSDDASLPVPQGLLCLRCRYALKGTAPDGVCPECALPVAESLARPGLTNAPVAVLARLRFWSLMLGSSLILMLALAVAFYVALMMSFSFFMSSPSPVASALLVTIPPALLVAIAAMGAAAIKTTGSLHAAGCCSSRARRLVTVGAAAFAAGWALTLVDQFVYAGELGEWLLSIIVCGGGVTVAVCWSQVQRMAARSLGGRARRSLCMLQLVVAWSLACSVGVVVFGRYEGLALVPGAYVLYSLARYLSPFLLVATMALGSVNALALSISVRRLINARRHAA